MQPRHVADAPQSFHVMAKPAGPMCNLDCRYCFYAPKKELYPGARFRMTDHVLKEYTRQYVEAQSVPEVTITWQGGEPTLMGLDFFRRSITYQRRHSKPGMTIHNTLQTNGTTLDDEWCKFFREHDFLVGISIDGPRTLHDAYRLDKRGEPTFRQVMNGLRLLQKHGVRVNALTTVHAANAAFPLEVYRFLRDEARLEFLQFIPIVERDSEGKGPAGARVTERSVGAGQYGRFVTAIFDEWVRRDVGRVFVQLFDVALAAWVGAPPLLCVFSPTCGDALALEHNGDLYACDHYVDPQHFLGNITDTPLIDLVASDRQRRFGAAKREALPQYCRVCEVRFACHGGCPKDRLEDTPEGEAGLNYLCTGYRAFFNHVDGPMRVMASLLCEGRAPAEIMEVVAAPEIGGRPQASADTGDQSMRRPRVTFPTRT